MPYFIQRRTIGKPIETIAEYNDSREAFKAVAKYNAEFPTAHHYVVRRACKLWRKGES
jgi:hypothetical protein